MAALLALSVVTDDVRAQQGQDPALVDALAQVLAVEDQRRWDEAILSTAARHPDPVVRRHAALAMGRMREPAALPILLERLSDPDDRVRRDAVFALGLLGVPEAIPALRDLALADVPAVGLEGGDVPQEAVAAIARIGGPSAAAVYGELLGNYVGRAATADVPLTVERGVEEAWRLGTEAPVNLLVEYSISPIRTIRLGAIYSLSRLRAPSAADVLLAAAEHRDEAVRMHAVRALTAAYADSAGLDGRALATRVRRLVTDPDPHVRVNALRSLGTFRDSGVVATVVDRLSDQDLNVRVQAAATLADLGGATAVTALRAQIDQRPFALQRQALVGLARLEGVGALDVIAGWITRDDWTFRHAGAEALGYIAADTILPWLVHLTRDADSRVVATALTSLVAVAPGMATRRARQLVRHDDPAVRTVAVDRLGAVPDTADLERIVAAWRRATTDSIPDARVAVVVALGRIAETSFAARVAVENRFLNVVPRPDDYLVRRAAHESFPLAAERWGPVRPIATGRGSEDYRDIVRRILLPGERGRNPQLAVETSQGRILLTLFGADAPLTVNALLQLVDARYFDGGRWHRVVPNFVIQDGDPRGDGWGGPGFALRDEVTPRRYRTGTVGMALSGPDTGGSQFFITHSPQPHLDGTYPIIGRVESGMDVVHLITQGDRIRRIRQP